MNDKERRGCKELLGKLSSIEIFSLCDTVTKKMIKVGSKEEAIDAVISCSSSSIELLNRRKITRDVLFQYLMYKGSPVSVNDNKASLTVKILKLWGISYSAESIQDDDDSYDISSTSGTSQSYNSGYSVSTSKKNQGVSTNHSTLATSTQTSDNSAHYQSKNDESSATGHNQNISTASSYVQGQSNISLTPSQMQGQGNISNLQSHVQVQGQGDISKDNSNMQGQGDQGQDKQCLAETFTRWFYKILNSNNPQTSETPEDFGPHHFWDDSRLMVISVTPDPSRDQYNGAELLSQRLLAFVKEELLLFNPNISREGVFVKSSPHGMLMIVVCGTIHRNNDCLGTFEQMFGLVADPRYDNNWKIKITKLKLQSEQVTAIPKLTDKNESELNALVAV